MPVLYLVGAANHRTGLHTVHSPKLNPETGHPAIGADKGIVSTTFWDGVANMDDNGTAKWLLEQGIASTILVPAYGLQRPGVGPVITHGDGGEIIEIEPAQPAALPAVAAAKK
jgi:hypothetical protein